MKQVCIVVLLLLWCGCGVRKKAYYSSKTITPGMRVDMRSVWEGRIVDTTFLYDVFRNGSFDDVYKGILPDSLGGSTHHGLTHFYALIDEQGGVRDIELLYASINKKGSKIPVLLMDVNYKLLPAEQHYANRLKAYLLVMAISLPHKQTVLTPTTGLHQTFCAIHF